MKGPDGRYDYTSAAWLTSVLNTQDTPLRTHLVTLTYSKLAAAVSGAIFGPDAATTPNANWFHFGTWATYSLNPNIRDDAAPLRLDSLSGGLRRRVTPIIVRSRSAGGNLVGQALAWGQYLIFASVATAGSKFVRTPPGLPWSKPPSFRADLTRLTSAPGTGRPGTSPEVLHSEGAWLDTTHGDLIDEAFGYYWLARQYVTYVSSATGRKPVDPGADPIVARLLLLGTVLLTTVEQDIIDGALRAVIDAVPVRWLKTIDTRVSAFVAPRRGVPRQAVALNLLDYLADVGPDLTDAFARFMTDQMLVMCLPRETLRVGRDIPPVDPTAPLYPEALNSLDQLPISELNNLPASLRDGPSSPASALTAALERLGEVVDSLDRTGADGTGSGARDWRRFDDRLNWAICLFRSRQQDPTLSWPPYSEEDADRLHHGRLPRRLPNGPPVPPLHPETEQAIAAFLEADRAVTDDA